VDFRSPMPNIAHLSPTSRIRAFKIRKRLQIKAGI
jgi:hypothetical protein